MKERRKDSCYQCDLQVKTLTSLKALKEKVNKDVKQAGAELCQARVELEVIVEVVVEFGVEVEACHY